MKHIDERTRDILLELLPTEHPPEWAGVVAAARRRRRRNHVRGGVATVAAIAAAATGLVLILPGGTAPPAGSPPGTSAWVLSEDTFFGRYELREVTLRNGAPGIEITRPDGARSSGGFCTRSRGIVIRLCHGGMEAAGMPLDLSGSVAPEVAAVAAVAADGTRMPGVVGHGRFLIVADGRFRPVTVAALDGRGAVLGRSDGDGLIASLFETVKPG